MQAPHIRIAVGLAFTAVLAFSACSGQTSNTAQETSVQDTGTFDTTAQDAETLDTAASADISDSIDMAMANNDTATADDAAMPDDVIAEDINMSDTDPIDPTTPPACPVFAPTAPPAALGLDPFYQKYVDAGGIPLVGSDKVPDEAFGAAYYVVANMLRGRPCVRQALASSGIRIGIMALDEVTSDMPEYRDFYEAFPGVDWDTRGRGFGATLVRPLTTGSVENLLEHREDRWLGENILLHEVAHTYFEFGVRGLEGGDDYQRRLDDAYAEASTLGLWDNTYASTNAAEYWAEGVQSWMGSNLEADPPNGIHNHVDTRAELEAHDPTLAALIAELFEATPWVPTCDPSGNGPAWQDPTPADPWSTACTLTSRYPDPLECAQESGLASQESTQNATFTVVNRSYDRTYSVAWLDFDGTRVPYGAITPRSQWSISTFVTHPWLISDENGVCVGIFEPEPNDTHAVFE